MIDGFEKGIGTIVGAIFGLLICCLATFGSMVVIYHILENGAR